LNLRPIWPPSPEKVIGMPSDPFPLWPGLAIPVLLIALAATPVLRCVNPPPDPNGRRIATLDGLRGLAAIGVFLHHGVITHGWLATGLWLLPASSLYTLLGQGAVALFFMITGFLFWSALIATGGRLNPVKFLIGRVGRIAPIYLCAAAAVIGIVFWRTGLTLHEPPRAILHELVKWSALGVFDYAPDINASPHTVLILAGVIWTLHWEWLFYFALIPVAVLARNRTIATIAPALALVVLLLAASLVRPAPLLMHRQDEILSALFAAGMLCASAAPAAARMAPPWLRSSLALALLAAVFAGADTAYAPLPLLGLAGAFLLIASGADLFGLLTFRPVQRLGQISYGLYLLQGLLLTAAFAQPAIRARAMAEPLLFWAVLAVAGIFLTLLASLAHVAVERPGIRAARRLSLAMPGLASRLAGSPIGRLWSP
jgi:peptidoglycan/LPS O-acetylase OafA/YrhL